MELWLLLLVCLTSGSAATDKKDVPHSRQKRILWITNDGRLALPPGTSLVISPSLSMPFIRHPPEGFFSNVTISLPFTIDFDKLGLTDNENPYGALPPLLARSLGRTAGEILVNFIGKYLDKRRGKRSTDEQNIPPNLQTKILDFFHGGERAILYGAVEDMITNFGLAGKPCLLRAICEVHAHPLTNFGFLGETLKLFFTASKSPYSDLMQEYVAAEKAGTGDREGPGECWPYYKDCPKSMFLTQPNKYLESAEYDNHVEDEIFDKEHYPKFTKVTLKTNLNNVNAQPM